MWRVSRILPRSNSSNTEVALICSACSRSPSYLQQLVRNESTPSASENKDQGSSSSSSGSQQQRSGGGWFWKFLGLTVIGGGGVVGYAWYSPEFRHNLEVSVPYTKESFDFLFQYLPSAPEAKQPPKPTVRQESTNTQKAQSPKVPVQQPSIPSQASAAGGSAAAAAGAAAPTGRATAVKEEAAEKKGLERESEAKERGNKDVTNNNELEVLLERLQDEARNSVSQAISDLNAAAESVRSHSKHLKEALQTSGTEREWSAASESHQSRADAILKSDTAKQRAIMSLDKLKSTISDGKANKATKKNKTLKASEAEVSRLNAALTVAIAELSKAESEVKSMSEYKDLAKKGKEQFQKELEETGEKKSSSKLTEEELNSLIGHAHRRIEHLQRQLAELQATEPLRVERALERQRDEDEKHAKELVQLETERLKAELSSMLHAWGQESRIESEKDLRAQLTRQAAAHSDHIVEVLRVQQRELSARHEREVTERLAEERRRFDELTSGYVAKLRGIEGAVEARAELEQRARNAQELWLACHTLATILSRGQEISLNNGPRDIASELRAIEKAGSGTPYVTSILSSLPDVATKQGIWTEEALAERFVKVAKLGRRVALIDERGGTLFRYFLSYVQSFFVLQASRNITRDTIVAPGELSTFDLLNSAAACMDCGDLEQAVRFVNQLRGEPRKVASDWLTDARHLLETRQVAEALLAFATATGLSSLF